jgi:hypothetical protein
MMQLLLIKLSNWLMSDVKPKKKKVIRFKKVIKKGKKFI